MKILKKKKKNKNFKDKAYIEKYTQKTLEKVINVSI